jgi:serine/threonine protein kinase
MNQQEFLERYQFNVRQDRLGGGSFGTVYKAYDTTRDRYVAIKVAEVRTVGGKTFSLDDELQAVASLPEHRNLAHYEGVHQFESPAGIFDYAVMQYYPAGNLRELLDRGGLRDNQRMEIARGILRGLAHLHQHQVIHRDLKPSNVLIARVGEQYIPKIADFGLSKRVGEGSRFSNSLAGGTLAYSAPEQLLGRPVRLNADLWSAGVLLFELFLGYRPFRPQEGQASSAARDRELYDQIVNAPLPPETAALPPPFAVAVEAFLVKDPDRRARRILPEWTGDGPVSPPPDQEATFLEAPSDPPPPARQDPDPDPVKESAPPTPGPGREASTQEPPETPDLPPAADTGEAWWQVVIAGSVILIMIIWNSLHR